MLLTALLDARHQLQAPAQHLKASPLLRLGLFVALLLVGLASPLARLVRDKAPQHLNGRLYHIAVSGGEIQTALVSIHHPYQRFPIDAAGLQDAPHLYVRLGIGRVRHDRHVMEPHLFENADVFARSEERRVGKEWGCWWRAGR